MKQYVFFVFCLLVNFSLISQDQTITTKLSKFSRVKVFDGISVNLIKSSENKAIVTGANTSNVKFVVANGELKVRMAVTKLFSGYRTFVDLHYRDALVVIDVNEDARIISTEKINQDVIELKAQEGGELQINAEVEQMLIRSVSGGIITTTGISDIQDVAINTGGSYLGKDFKTNFTTVNVNAGSKAEIYASDYVKATVKAGGEVLVYGDPTKMDEKTVFGGKVTRM
ncbi:head GIN domain-containing protein [Eudoraea chungangensis]|uniref:head GIN domain-containing protein n=1 Tax=Eudoraea chungangensis TaxID=1481905 RepID=UPI0023EAB4EC|nr:head GIN domain-containing protein [Eudoraea chungangensis]